MTPQAKERLKAGSWFIGSVLGALLVVHLYIGEFLLFKSASASFLRTFGSFLVWPLRFLANITPAVTIPWIIFLMFRSSGPRAGGPRAAASGSGTFSWIVLSVGIYLLTVFLFSFFEHFLPGSITEITKAADEWVDTFWIWSVIVLAVALAVYSAVWLIVKLGPWLVLFLLDLCRYIARFVKWVALSLWRLVADVFHDIGVFFQTRPGKILLKIFMWFTITALLAAVLFLIGEYLWNRYF